MLINLFVLAITILIGAGVTFWLDQNSLPDSSMPQVEQVSGDTTVQNKMPSFAFTDLKGKHIKIEDFSDQIILINFWATWCAPCIVEFPKLVELARRNPHIVLVALSSDIQDDQIRRFLKKNPALPSNFIVARDQKRKITTDIFQTYKLPETLIVSRSGDIIKKVVGDTDWTGPDIQNLLDSLDSKKGR